MSAPREVGLDEVLAARDARAARQRALLRRRGLPLVSLTLVSPGPRKAGLRARRVMLAALAALEHVLSEEVWPAVERETLWLPTGPEALFAVNAQPEALKRRLARLEDEHPLGRLWDLDVLTGAGALSRGELGLPPRRCLLCGEAAHACSRSRRHPLPELLRAIEEKVDAFQRNPQLA
nr:citrate lyase holo-[acyl-carrier protein] synthase [Chromobacterium sp. ASV5]